MKTQDKILRLCIMAMLTALSIVILYTLKPFRYPFIPLEHLEHDFADVPILIGAMTLGPAPGLIILLAVCIIQATAMSGGPIGFFMHFVASAALVLVASGIYNRKRTVPRLIIGLVAGTIAMTIVMIPLNIVFQGFYNGAPIQAIIDMLLPAIIPFNLLKAGINSAITFAVFTPVSNVLKKYTKVGKK